ncbi:unnamed protein product [Clonostachys rosea f. rosea IK726]|uniref:Uncharacterized protein n=2 Tax=Bionectria ochroleuca TaxID=29856 RepID=A0A0B7K1K6_BIOOC|nr:unnamed protein product [Clonostachys rosea f. rosea IK726]
MMVSMLGSVVVYSYLAAHAFAATVPIGHSGNLTVAFFSNELGGSCDINATTNRLALTTQTIPNSYTCFNVSDIFSQSNTTGFTNATQHVYNTDEPNGIFWRLESEGSYDSQTNYSRVWYEQYAPGNIQVGENASWVVYFYAFPDCKQLDPEKEDADPDLNPWFEDSCQTEPGGQCRTTPYSIRSFAINSAEDYNKGHGGCETWAYQGSSGAPSFSQPSRTLSVILGGLAMFATNLW